MRKTNDAGIALIKEFESLELKAYYDSVGVITVGFGHTGPDVHPGLEISEGVADQLLRQDLGKAEAGVEAALTKDVTSNQFSACVALAFNIGVGAFRSSSIVKFINAGDLMQAADRFLLYNKAGGKVLKGLVRRREAERKLFLTPDEEPDSAPEPLPGTPASVQETVVQQQSSSSVITSITSNDTVKEIAKSGVTTIGTRISTALATGGLLSAIDSFVTDHWAGLIFAGGLILLAVIVALFILWHKHVQQQQAAMINADPGRIDISFK